MKTFKQLTIGDTIYKVFTNYYGKEKPTYSLINVNKVELIERNKQKYISVNRNDRYNEGEFDCLVVDGENDFIADGDKGFFTTNYNNVIEGLKKAALKFIKDEEDRIKSSKNEIERIRLVYWDYLNNNVSEPLVESIK